MHHLTARSIAEEHIFKDSGDYVTGIGILAGLVGDGLFVCHQFCFMPTHYHVFGTFTDLSGAIHKLNRRYAVRFNRRCQRRGRVFDSPACRTEITTDAHLLELPRYIALNPEHPETWPYSSYPGLIGTGEPFSFVDPTPIVNAFGSVAAFRRHVTRVGSSERRKPGSAAPPRQPG